MGTHRTLTKTAAAALPGWTGRVGFRLDARGTVRQPTCRNESAATRVQRRHPASPNFGRCTTRHGDDVDQRLLHGRREEAIKQGQVSGELRDRLLAKPKEFYDQLTAELAIKENPITQRNT